MANKTQQLGFLVNGVYVDPSTLNVGINTITDAGYKLDVNGTGRFSGSLTLGNGVSERIISASSYIEMYNASSGDMTLFSGYPGASIKFCTNNSSTPKLTIASTGAATFSSSVQTGILGLLHPTTVTGSNASPSYENLISYTSSSVGTSQILGSNYLGSSYGTGLQFRVNSEYYTNDPITAMTIRGLGAGYAVGIGTSSPTDGKLVVSNAGPSIIALKETSVGVHSHWNASDGSNTFFGNVSNHPLTIITNNTERMRITSGDDVYVTRNADASRFGILNTKSGGKNWYLNSYSNANLYLQIDAANLGNFNGTTGTYTAMSDFNKKKDFEQCLIGLDAILNLKPTLYRFKTEKENAKKHLGFIAQEVKDFIPQAYVEDIMAEDTFIGLTEMPIIAALVKGMQEQNETITKQGLQINELKQQLNK